MFIGRHWTNPRLYISLKRKVCRGLNHWGETQLILSAFNCTDEENASSLATLRRRAWLALRAKIDEQTADPVLLGKLRTHFEERFRYDEDGIPRVWKPDDDIDGAFKKAKDQVRLYSYFILVPPLMLCSQTLELISLYSRIRPQDPENAYEFSADTLTAHSDDHQLEEEFDFESSLTVLSETKVLDLSSRFRKDADAYYVEAKRSTVSSIAQIPTWMYGVLVVLGWNEAMAVLFNPLYFTALLCALATGSETFLHLTLLLLISNTYLADG